MLYRRKVNLNVVNSKSEELPIIEVVWSRKTDEEREKYLKKGSTWKVLRKSDLVQGEIAKWAKKWD